MLYSRDVLLCHVRVAYCYVMFVWRTVMLCSCDVLLCHVRVTYCYVMFVWPTVMSCSCGLLNTSEKGAREDVKQ